MQIKAYFLPRPLYGYQSIDQVDIKLFIAIKNAGLRYPQTIIQPSMLLIRSPARLCDRQAQLSGGYVNDLIFRVLKLIYPQPFQIVGIVSKGLAYDLICSRDSAGSYRVSLR